MQFGPAIHRILHRIAYANPAFGPVYLSKFDLSEGYYRVPLNPQAALQLAVVLPPLADISKKRPPSLEFPSFFPWGGNTAPHSSVPTQKAPRISLMQHCYKTNNCHPTHWMTSFQHSLQRSTRSPNRLDMHIRTIANKPHYPIYRRIYGRLFGPSPSPTYLYHTKSASTQQLINRISILN
jgi:hypothetical protein